MSRCFPYPPLGCVRNGARGGEAVSESVKLPGDWGKAITEHDKKRKEKKERKKNNKENNEGCYIPDTCNEPEKIPLPKGEEEAERSGLTEEHELSANSQSLSCSFESARSDNESAFDGTESHGNIVRIRLPVKRPREVNASINGEQLCSTSGRSDSFQQQKPIIFRLPIKERCSSINSKSGIDTSGPINAPSGADLEGKDNSFKHSVKTSSSASGLLPHEAEEQKAESPHKALFEDWVPLPLEFGKKNFDDREWLFGTNRQEIHGSKRCKSQHDVPINGTSTVWPRAWYLPDADIHALPFSIPF